MSCWRTALRTAPAKRVKVARASALGSTALTRSASSSSASSSDSGAPAARTSSSSSALTHSTREGSRVGGSDSPGHSRCAGGGGVAVFGEDGRTSSELIEAAEEARFAAEAVGVEVLGRDEP